MDLAKSIELNITIDQNEDGTWQAVAVATFKEGGCWESEIIAYGERFETEGEATIDGEDMYSSLAEHISDLHLNTYAAKE